MSNSSLRSGKVFGGSQIIVSGDFFQLPPVICEEKDKYFRRDDENNEQLNNFAFSSDEWKELNFEIIELKVCISIYFIFFHFFSNIQFVCV